MGRDTKPALPASEVVRFVPGEQSLRYNFTPEERQQLGQDLAQALAEQSGIAEELETIKAQFKGRLNEVGGRVNQLANKVRSGWEMRVFKVEKRMDLKNARYSVVRLDTGEVVEERVLYENEKQIALDMGKELPKFD